MHISYIKLEIVIPRNILVRLKYSEVVSNGNSGIKEESVTPFSPL